jgi:phage/plasmid-like protein (TIGR03299 family)
MAHEIESIAWTGERPWHGLGTEVLHCMTSEEAIVAAGLHWEVEKRKLFIHRDDPNAELGFRMVEVPGHFAIVRVTDGSPLGVVGAKYTPLQNRSAFTFFDELVGAKEAIYETAGSLRGGRIVWIMSKLPGMIGWSDDPIEKWLVLSNAHDGSRKVSLLVSPVRVVCMNTLRAATSAALVNFEMVHTANIMDRVIDARDALGKVTDYFEQLDAMLKTLRDRQMSDVEIRTYVHNLFPLRVRTTGVEAGVEEAINAEYGPRIKKHIEKVLELTETGKGTEILGVKGTAYGALNAAVEFADHYQPVKGKAEMLNRKLDSIWFGSAARFKQMAFDEAMALAA